MGKTSISGYIAKKMGVDIVISGDYLREFLRPLLSENEFGILDLSVYDAWQKFGEMNDQNIVLGYQEQAGLLWKGMEKILERAMSNGESLIIETLYFVPSFFKPLLARGLYSAYIYISDPKLHADRLLERQKFTHFDSPGERLAGHLKEYRTIMEHTMDAIRENNLSKLYDNINYSETKDLMLRDAEEFFDKRVT